MNPIADFLYLMNLGFLYIAIPVILIGYCIIKLSNFLDWKEKRKREKNDKNE